MPKMSISAAHHAMPSACTHPRPIRRLSPVFIIMPDFVKVVFVQLAHKTCEIAMLEVLRQDVFRKLLILRRVSTFILRPSRAAVPRALRSCRLRYPSAPHSRPAGSPASCHESISVQHVISEPWRVLVELANLVTVSTPVAMALTILLGARTYKVAGIVARGSLINVHLARLPRPRRQSSSQCRFCT